MPLRRATSRLLANRPLLAVLAAFAASRIAYAAMGVRFDASPLGVFWQYIDPPLLRHHLIQSLWYLHSQPPLYNLLLGVVLKASGSHYAAVFQVLYLGLGVALAVSLFHLMCRLGASGWLSAAFTALFVVSPPTALYENWLYVEYLAVTCLVAGALFLHRFAEAGLARDAAIAFALLLVVVLSRPLFHLVWLLGLVALVWLMQPGRRRRVLAAAALPVALTLGVYVKNYVLFDTVSSTSCSGINAARVTTDQLTHQQVQALVRQGKLSRFALYSPFGLALTMPQLFREEPKRGIPLLDERLKSTGAPNIDNAAYLHICPHYLKDAWTVLKTHPGAFKRGVQEGTFIYWRPTSQYAFFDSRNRRSTKWIERAFGLVMFGQLHPAKDLTALALEPRGDYSVGRRIGEVAWLALAAYVAAVAFALAVLWRAWRERGPSPLALVAAYVLFNIVWVTLVGTMFEAGENNRFRFLVDPLTLSLVAALVGRVPWRVVVRRSRLAPAGAP